VSVSRLFLERLIYLIFISLLIFSQNTGFDFYSHSLSYSYGNVYLGWNFYSFDFDRYLLLSKIYTLFGYTYIPLGWVIYIIIIIPCVYILRQALPQGGKYSLHNIVILSAMMYFVLYYSAINLGLLYLLAFFMSKKNIFMVGLFFHPVLLVLTPFLLNTSNKYFIACLFICIGLFYYLFPYDFGVKSISENAIISKINILLYVPLFFVMYTFLKNLYLNKIFFIFFIAFILMSTFLVALNRNSINLITNTVLDCNNDIMTAVWHDKKIIEKWEYLNLNSERYTPCQW
jgi:hypothetical protein